MKVIFINFFGGILPCDKVAASIITASEEIETSKPIVLRIKGNNSEVAKKMFCGKEETLGIRFSEDMD